MRRIIYFVVGLSAIVAGWVFGSVIGTATGNQILGHATGTFAFILLWFLGMILLLLVDIRSKLSPRL